MDSEKLLYDTFAMNENRVAEAIEKVHRNTTTPLYYNNEQALRSVIHFAYISCIGEYTEIQDLPAGQGYADVVYLPKKGSVKPVLIIELKWNKSAMGAIQQIKNNHYPDLLQNHGSEVLLVGINYDEKTKRHSCKIEKYQL